MSKKRKEYNNKDGYTYFYEMAENGNQILMACPSSILGPDYENTMEVEDFVEPLTKKEIKLIVSKLKE